MSDPRPAYMSRATLAATLDVSVSTVDDMVRRGVLPRPIALSTGCVRFCWGEVETALQARKNAPGEPADPYTIGARNVGQALQEHPAQGRRRLS